MYNQIKDKKIYILSKKIEYSHYLSKMRLKHITK